VRGAHRADRFGDADEGAREKAPRGVRVLTAGAPPAASTIERLEGELAGP